MKLRGRIILLMSGLLLAFIVAVVFISVSYTGQLLPLFDSQVNSEKYQFTQLIRLNNEGNKLLADSYSYWDDMVEFVKTRDPQFAEENLTSGLSDFRSEGSWVFNPKRELVFSSNIPGEEALKSFAFSNEVFEKIDRDTTLHFFVYQNGKLAEVVGYKIVPTADPERKTPAKGYFLTAHVWNDAFLDELSSQINGSVSLAENSPSEAEIESAQDRSTILLGHPLTDENGKVIRYAKIEIASNLLNRIVSLLIVFFVLAIGFVVIALMVTLLFMHTWVIRPVISLANSLSDREIAPATKLAANRWEIGQLARAVVSFMGQEKQLIHAGQEAERMRRLTQTYLESIGEGVVAIDRNWHVTLWNATAVKITGYPEFEALGKPLRDLVKIIRQSDRRENISFIEDVMVTGRHGSLQSENLLIAKGGHEISIGGSASPILGPDGHVIGAVLVLQDVTGQKDAKMLHSDFAYMAHQLRTPVSGAMGVFDMILEDKDRESIEENLNMARGLLKSALRLSEQALMVSDLDEKIIVPKPRVIKLAEAVGAVVSRLETEPELPKVHIEAKVDSGLEIDTDAALLERALGEVLRNAIMYGDSAQPIVVEASESAKGILIEISHSGDGIMEEEQALIFTKFFRGGNFDKTKLPGSGLGTYISRELIALLGGKIWFNSNKTSTTFSILLPAKDGHAQKSS